MAGDREAFDEAMQAAANSAWEANWDRAADAYQEALTQFPEDVDALTGLGMAYARSGKSRKAADAYGQASNLAPEDPVLLERLGKALEELGQWRKACKAYMAGGTQHIKQQSLDLAARCFQNAIRVRPDSVEAHVALLKHYQQHKRIEEAVGECRALARIYRDRGHIDYGIRVCKHGLQLSPRDSRALTLLDELRRTRQSLRRHQREEGQAPETALQTPRLVALPDADTLEFRAGFSEQPAEQKGSPVDRARERALTQLAESVFADDEGSGTTRAERLGKEAVDALISQAIDFQTRGKIEKSIGAYQRVIEAGAEGPPVRFNLGLLYQEQLRFEDAVAQFERTVSHPDYKLGSHFALGECYRARGRVDDALEHFIEVLRIVDLATIQREHADDLITLYEHLTDGYLLKGDEDQALEFANSLVTFLTKQGWEDKVKLARQRLDTLTQQGPVVTLAEALTVPDYDRILESIALSQEYAKRGMYYTAMEECHSALGSAHNYLPIHRQLAQVSREMGRIEESVKKLVVIADTYHVRGAARQATAIYQQALKLAPMDTSVRPKLIDLHVSHGQIERALREYLILADSYQQLAQMDKAREIYEEALRLVPRVAEEREWKVRILHRIGDTAMRRVDWKGAVSVYEQIRGLAPGDERAHLTLVDLFYRLDQPRRALEELDDLLRIYREEGRSGHLFTVLGDIVERWPDVIPLRARLAQAHLDAGHTEEALDHLEQLGNLQVDVGQIAHARATIQAIIALQPSDVGEYKRLLEEISEE